MNVNLKQVAHSLVSDKWLLCPSIHALLLKQVNKLMEDDYDYTAPEPPAADFTIEADDQSQFIAIIHVSGILMKAVSPEAEEFLGLCNTDRISQALDEAIENPAVTEIVLKFHSPGGTTNGIEELGRKIKYADSIKPVVAFTDTVCASAAYWLASQARVIGMTPSASIGNVGVYALIEDHSKALEAAGINVQPISAGKFKLMGHPFRPLTDEEKTILQEDTVNHHNKFKAVIKANRQIDDEYLEGLSYEGEAALKYNFVDYVVDSFEEFITTTEEDTI